MHLPLTNQSHFHAPVSQWREFSYRWQQDWLPFLVLRYIGYIHVLGFQWAWFKFTLCQAYNASPYNMEKVISCPRLTFPDLWRNSVGFLCHALSSLFPEPSCSPGCITQDVGTSASPKQTQHLLLPGSRWRQPMAELPLKLANPARVFHCLSGHWFVKSTVDTSVCQTEHHRWPTFPSLNFILLTPKSSVEHTPPILFC